MPSRTDPGPGPGGRAHPGDLDDRGQQPPWLLPFLEVLSAPLPWTRPRPPPLEGSFFAAQRLGVTAVDPVVSLTLPPQLLETCNANRKW